MNGIIFHLTDKDMLEISGEEIHDLAKDTVQILIEARPNPCTYGINDFTRVACLMLDTYINVLIATETNINSTIYNLIKRSTITQNDYLFIVEQIYDYILKWVDTL